MPIEIKHLDHIYMPGSPFETKALDDVTLTIGDGEFVGLIGHTGSGKSTLVQHLNGLMKPDHGSVIVDGMDVSDKNTARFAAASDWCSSIPSISCSRKPCARM